MKTIMDIDKDLKEVLKELSLMKEEKDKKRARKRIAFLNQCREYIRLGLTGQSLDRQLEEVGRMLEKRNKAVLEYRPQQTGVVTSKQVAALRKDLRITELRKQKAALEYLHTAA